MRTSKRIDPGKLRNKLAFYEQVATPTAHGNSTVLEFVEIAWANKNTQIQRSNFASLGGANIDNQDVIFTIRKNPNFQPSKSMLINDLENNEWYNIASFQPLEDPAYYTRILAIRKDKSFNPVVGT
jgi:head-tail adaptor